MREFSVGKKNQIPTRKEFQAKKYCSVREKCIEVRLSELLKYQSDRCLGDT